VKRDIYVLREYSRTDVHNCYRDVTKVETALFLAFLILSLKTGLDGRWPC